MSKTDRILEGLLTGDPDQDNRLRKAFERGIRHGQASDREAVQRTAQIDQTTRLLVKLMRNRNLDLEQAMTVFELSRDDKQMYRRIIGGRQAKKT